MTAAITAAAGSVPDASAGVGTTRAQLQQTARQFEAILLRQVLAEARKADFGETPFSDGAQGGGLATFREMMDARFADIATSTDALGLGKLIADRLERLMPGTGTTGGTARP